LKNGISIDLKINLLQERNGSGVGDRASGGRGVA